MNKKVYIIGAGGHGQVVLDCLRSLDVEVYGFLDDEESLLGKIINGVKVLGKIDLAKSIEGLFVVAVGDNKTRKKIVEELSLEKEKFVIALHKNVAIGTNVEIGEGSMIIGGVIVNTNSRIGRHAIINTSASIDHHNIIEDFVHVAPGVHTGGNVYIKEGAFIGIGASIIPGITIGRWAVIGAGSVIIEDVPDYATVVGNPGKVIKVKGEKIK